MKVYVAARDFTLAKGAMTFVREWGHEITFDWTKYPPGTRTEEAATDMRSGVERADVLALIGWDDDMLGALIEVGIAIGNRIPVVLVAYNQTPARDSLFWCLPDVTFASNIHELGDYLAAYGGGRPDLGRRNRDDAGDARPRGASVNL